VWLRPLPACSKVLPFAGCMPCQAGQHSAAPAGLTAQAGLLTRPLALVSRPAGTIAERGQDEVYKRAGLLSQADDAAAPQAAAGGSSSGPMTCMVCLSDVPASKATAMDCGHLFCNDCWREHMR